MNVVAVTLAFIEAIAVQESPLTAVQMLWLNLIMDSLPHSGSVIKLSHSIWRLLLMHIQRIHKLCSAVAVDAGHY